jgi:DNA ligase-1
VRAFGELFERLDTTTSLNEKLAALVDYFRIAPPEDAAWAVYFLSGRRLRRLIGGATLKAWLLEASGLPDWLVEETRAAVGDLAETIALLIETQTSGATAERPLAQWIAALLDLAEMAPERQRDAVVGWWRELDARGCFLLNKLLTGELRVGVSAGLVERALAELTRLPRPVIAHRLMGVWQPTADFWSFVNAPADVTGDVTRPYPFSLAAPLEAPFEKFGETLGSIDAWLAEWKWDGIRAQLITRASGVYLWSRGEELITDRFPELVQKARALPADVVLDGEIVVWRDGAVQPFGELQRRIGRTKLSAKIVNELPVQLLAYDVLEIGGIDLRREPLHERRRRLTDLLATTRVGFALSPDVAATSWDALRALRAESRERSVEGLMLKRLDAPYEPGRKRGAWWKWKIEPYTFDGVLVYAQPGRGRRANLLTDYTFAVHDGEALVPVAKAYSGLTDTEIARVDRWIRQNTVERFGPVRSVRPELVFEIAFEAINESKRHKSGVAVRFPRIARWRQDKPAAEADTLIGLRQLLNGTSVDARAR